MIGVRSVELVGTAQSDQRLAVLAEGKTPRLVGKALADKAGEEEEEEEEEEGSGERCRRTGAQTEGERRGHCYCWC